MGRVPSASLDVGRAAGPLEVHADLFSSVIEDALLLHTVPSRAPI